MSKRLYLHMLALLLVACSANAEIETVVKSITGDSIKLPRDTACFVRERGVFMDGGESSISGLFSESGLKVSKEEKSDCVLVVGASISVQHKNNPTSTVVSKLVNENDVMEELKNFAETDTQDDPKSVLGQTVGAGVSAAPGVSTGTGVLLLAVGSLADSRPTKFISCDTVGIWVAVKYKDAQGKKTAADIKVVSKATPYDRPIAVLRAAVKRTVVEMQKNSASDVSATNVIEVQK